MLSDIGGKMTFLYNYVRSICFFSLMISLVLNIFPESSNKKYIKLFAGIVLLAMILNPIIGIKNNIDFDKKFKDIAHGNYIFENQLYERISEKYDGFEEGFRN